MIKLIERKHILPVSAILIMFISLLLFVLPPEKNLGKVIRVVYIHAVLVQTGLLLFSAAGLIGLLSLFRKSDHTHALLLAMQKTGLLIWSIYLVSSAVVTRLAWGIWVAWEEPRVVAGICIWLTALLFFALVLWIGNDQFSALANLALAIIAVWLTKTSGTIRHPLDPIGESNSLLLKMIFFLLFFIVLVLAVQCIRLFLKPENRESFL